MKVNEKIKALRTAMKENDIDAYIIPSSDAHQSEYVAAHWKVREWISGFSGSAGTVIITDDHAGLWTDSRYFLQAETELADSEMELHKQGIPHAPEHQDWLRDVLPEGATVAFDGQQYSVENVFGLEKKLKSKKIKLEIKKDLIKSIWTDRTPLPSSKIFEHGKQFAGKTRNEKLKEIRNKMTADYYLVTALDEIAWAFNLRGSDVECNPVFYAYAVIGREEAWLFTAAKKLKSSLKEKLAEDNISLLPYKNINSFLRKREKESFTQLDKGTTNILLYRSLKKGQAVEGENIIQKLKAIKNEVEIANIRHAMRKDGVALTRFFRWLEATLEDRTVLETEAAEILAKFRSQQEHYHGESFDAIVGYKGNGAIIHYHPQKETCAAIAKDGILLLDSGGQYEDGTTDITRTISLGHATDQQKFCYTRVLKGHIELSAAFFPTGTRGAQLDTLARMHLWQAGLNYGHGTGHGVGFFLNVHEGPQGFASSPVTSRGRTILEPNMVTSNEPGFYRTDEFGIRIENLIVCVEAGKNEYGTWLKFEDLTLFPIDTDLIQIEQLTDREKKWLNSYHRRVFKELSPMLNKEEIEWLKDKTETI